MHFLDSIDTQQFFATVAQVVPVLVLALVIEARRPWFDTSKSWRRKALILLAAVSEVAALVATLYKPAQETRPDPVETFVILLAAAFCLLTVSIVVSVLAAILVKAVGAGSVPRS